MPFEYPVHRDYPTSLYKLYYLTEVADRISGQNVKNKLFRKYQPVLAAVKGMYSLLATFFQLFHLDLGFLAP